MFLSFVRVATFLGTQAILLESVTTFWIVIWFQPSLLFGWHEDNKCCVWCPSEGNYTIDDVSLAYIVGAAFSPNLGPCDVMDDWKPSPDGILLEEITTSDDACVVYRCFREASEVRTIERWEVECCGCKSTEVGSGKKR
ncbi:hypothetical protein WN944_007324 [Citrus x changshan-huyou]|uniref:Uncharacterized protein n=1 Tax=Citrus x changshan-huyou TaxID=2935761 RepID=A0AAP0MN38_9ROSI